MNLGGGGLRVNLLIHAHTAGLRKDLTVFRRALRCAGIRFAVTVFDPQMHNRAVRAMRKLGSHLSFRPPFDINIFVEDIVERWCSLARVNVLVPHQEWVFEGLRAKIPAMDVILCKTRYAEGLFRDIGCAVRYIGFTSPDRGDASVPKDYNRFIHVAGSSLQKGTATINDVWLRHPEWPHLTLFSYEPRMRARGASNIGTVTSFVDDAVMRGIQNSSGVHLCPSEAEGFGHYLVEAMSTGALVLTTDGPPMNELVSPDRGVLAGYHQTRARGMGMNYYVDPGKLEDAVMRILGMSQEQRKEMGERARAWYVENDRAFLVRLQESLEEIGAR